MDKHANNNTLTRSDSMSSRMSTTSLGELVRFMFYVLLLQKVALYRIKLVRPSQMTCQPNFGQY